MPKNIDTNSAKILRFLIDRYENSKTFAGSNKGRQTFRAKISEILPQYSDDSEYSFYMEANAGLAIMEDMGLVILKKEKNGRIEYADLCIENIEKAYICLGRKPKSQKNKEILALFEEYGHLDENIYDPLLWHIRCQKDCIAANKNIQFLNGGIEAYRDILKAAKAVLENKTEILVREFSVKLFSNSKRFEEIESQIRTLLYKSGEACGRPYSSRETVFEEHDILKTPSFIMAKGREFCI